MRCAGIVVREVHEGRGAPSRGPMSEQPAARLSKGPPARRRIGSGRRGATPIFLLAGWSLFTLILALSPPARVAEVNLLAFGDWGWEDTAAQRATAQQMAAYARTGQIVFDAALLLGDNFYGGLPGGVNDPRWKVGFEQMYDAIVLDMPFYAALGNHDYESGKAEAELAYPKQNPDSRWKMPAQWYRVEIPADKPVVSVLVLDSNAPLLKGQWADQLAWLETELAKPRPGNWVVAIAHHPVFSNGEHGDSQVLLKDWAPLFKRHRVDFFISGHDHQLEHLEVDGWPTSFVVAGGGGGALVALKRDDRGPFSRTLYGFFHLHLTPDQAAGKLVCVDGKVVHEFTRSATGEVKVVQTTGRDKPGRNKAAAN